MGAFPRRDIADIHRGFGAGRSNVGTNTSGEPPLDKFRRGAVAADGH
jgi:hypothetical protein